MNDTPDFIAQKQYEITMALPIVDRLKLTAGAADFSRRMAITRIRERNPTISDSELRYELIVDFYGDELPAYQLAEIKRLLLTEQNAVID